MTENEMVGRHHQFSGRELEQTPGDGEGQGSLVCCNHEVTESDTTERLNNTMPMYGIQKDFTDEAVCRAGIETQMQRTDMWKWGERVGETNIGTAGLTHKLCVTQMASGNLLHNTGSSAWCSVVT